MPAATFFMVFQSFVILFDYCISQSAIHIFTFKIGVKHAGHTDIIPNSRIVIRIDAIRLQFKFYAL